jgi:hypothetical protein
MALNPRARRLDREIELSIHERNILRVVALVDQFGLPRERDQRLAVSHELDRLPAEDVELRFDRFDQAPARTVAEVWRN